MPERTVVVNTTPLIALAAAGCFDALLSDDALLHTADAVFQDYDRRELAD